ncbi:MAG TPA: hypothetical protein VFK05_24340 [Polyangiaceae bacterium]|nr:hypothetical protein [Polyangiaceae bacterium]
MAEDPVRFWDEDQGEVMRSLLSAAREEQPTQAAIERTLTVVGVGTALAAVAASGSAAGVASGAGVHGLAAAASLSSAKGALGTSVLVVVKWLGAGVVMGLLATSAVYVGTQPNAPAVHTESSKLELAKPATPQRTIHAARTPSPASAPEVAEAPAAAKPPAPSNAALSAAAAPPVSGVPAEVIRDAQLAAEVSVLDRARQALALGDASGAVRSLNDYDARFTHPNLLPEALYLRLEALTLQGDQPGSKAVARRLLRSFPEGPHAARARAVLGLDK